MEPIAEEEYKGYTIKIYPDYDAESPREWDNLGTMICFHRNYQLGDKHSYKTPKEFKDFLGGIDAVSLPLFLYDHSGITMNTTGFSCPWDSGQVGVIYVEKDKILEEYGRKKLSKKLVGIVKRLLRSEVATYDQYLTGDVYGYVVEKDGEHTDSCWGFYGEKEAMNCAKETVT